MLPDTNDDPVIGALLDGRYQIVKLLGKGGMGNVYLAEETRLRRRCALKVLHPTLAEDRNNVERFLREAQTIAQFEHPNIVDIYSYGEEPSGVVFFAMELLIGEDLDKRLKARGERPYTIHDACLWGAQIARAMTVVHDAGLIHRDLKTSNIFLARRRDGEEIVKLLDFGIARPEEGSELTATGVALGTPSYMSPEQIRNTVVDRRSDIYSFGVLLFKLLTRRLPYSGDAIQMAMAHCLSEIPRPSEVAPEAGISPELDAMVMRAMAKDPRERQASMRELEDGLVAVLRAEAPEMAPSGRSPRPTTLPPTESDSGRNAASSLQPRTIEDAATPPGSLLSTGPTTATPVPQPRRRTRFLLIAASASLLVAGLLLGVPLLTGGAKQPPATVAASASPQPTAAPRIEAPPVEPKVETRPVVEAPPVEPVVTPPVAPVVTPPVEEPAATPPTREPEPRAKKVEAAPVPPLKQVERKAAQCRRRFKAVDGPKISIDVAVGIDGKVTRSIPAVADDLGKCLAEAVQSTQFEPKLVLGKKLSL